MSDSQMRRFYPKLHASGGWYVRAKVNGRRLTAWGKTPKDAARRFYELVLMLKGGAK